MSALQEMSEHTGVSTEDLAKLICNLRNDLWQDILSKVRGMGVEESLVLEFSDAIRLRIGDG